MEPLGGSAPCSLPWRTARREKRFYGCPGEASCAGSGAVRRGAAGAGGRGSRRDCALPRARQVAAPSGGPAIMAARFRRQILHLCGFLFLLLRTFFSFSLQFVPFAVEANFIPSNLLVPNCTGAKLIRESQQGSALITHELLTDGLKCSFIQIILFLLLLHNSSGRCLPAPRSLSRLFFLNQITSELPAPAKLLRRAAETEPGPSAALSPLLKAWLVFGGSRRMEGVIPISLGFRLPAGLLLDDTSIAEGQRSPGARVPCRQCLHPCPLLALMLWRPAGSSS